MELIFYRITLNRRNTMELKAIIRVSVYMKSTNSEIIRIGITSGSDRRRLCDSKRFQYNFLFVWEKNFKLQSCGFFPCL